VGVESFGGSIGQVYVYLMDGADHHVWRLHSIVPSAGGLNSYFGHSISIGNHTLVVGAPGKITDPFVGGPPPAGEEFENFSLSSFSTKFHLIQIRYLQQQWHCICVRPAEDSSQWL
jgi:hypothetical protein